MECESAESQWLDSTWPEENLGSNFNFLNFALHPDPNWLPLQKLRPAVIFSDVGPPPPVGLKFGRGPWRVVLISLGFGEVALNEYIVIFC